MNKKNMIFAVSLMLSIATTALPIGEQERGAIYGLLEVGHDLRTIGLNSQNVEMFIQLFDMNITKLEKELKAANSTMNSALIEAGALLGGGQLLTTGLVKLSGYGKKKSEIADFGINYGLNIVYSLKYIGSLWTTLNVYDAYKAKKTLTAALTLDKEIISQLLDLKDSLPANEQSAETA